MIETNQYPRLSFNNPLNVEKSGQILIGLDTAEPRWKSLVSQAILTFENKIKRFEIQFNLYSFILSQIVITNQAMQTVEGKIIQQKYN